MKKITALCLAGIFLFGCASDKPYRRVAATSAELQAGDMLHEKILADFRELNNPEIRSYVQKITSRLASKARRDLDYRAVILEDERIYAISAPGGKIYITTAFLAFLKNEAELAAVVGHEIGQLQYLDPRFDPMRKTVDGVTKAGTAIGPIFGQFGVLATLGLVGLHAMYARDPGLDKKLLASDRWAMQSMLEQKYDPQALLDVLKRFAEFDRESLTLFYDYYQSRPIKIERVHAAYAEYKNLNLEELELQTGFEEYRKNLEGLGPPSYR